MKDHARKFVSVFNCRTNLMSEKPSLKNRWTIAAIAVICMLAVYGIRHSFAAFFPSILNDYGWTRGSTALMFSINVLLYGILAPVAGSLADRWKPKLMMSLGILLLGFSAAACALANELWQFYVLFGILMSVGITFAGAPVITPMIANWFTNKRGMAMGIGVAGGTLSYSMVTYAEYLISIFSWRLSFVLLAGTIIGIAIPLVLLFFRYRPEQKVKPPDEMKEVLTTKNINKNPLESVNVSSDNGHLSLAAILKNYRLWFLMLTYMLYMGIANYMIIAHQVIIFIDLGYNSIFASSVAGAVGIFATLGALSGFLSDRMGREKIFTACCALSIISLLVLLSQKDASNPWALYIFVFFFGFPLGLNVPTITAGAADLFYGKFFGTVYGMMLLGFGIGGAIGPWLGGYIFDVTGSYSIALIIGIAAYFIAGISFWIAAPRKLFRHSY